ncbi:MAG: hypothetical protein HOY69_04255 [Streptomyces sp.]|nr:hypothetical protein [Streptomyces sp.]
MITAVRQTTELASSGVVAWAVILGIVIVAVLLAAFWWGARALAGRRGPGKGTQQRAESWHEPQVNETWHSARAAREREHEHEHEDEDRG